MSRLVSQAAVIREARRPMEIESTELDGELEPTEVLLRTAASGLCHSDLNVVTGTWDKPMPLVLGHEASAVVEAVGSDVVTVVPGDHVVVFCLPSCGRCAYCLAGRDVLCDAPPYARAPGARARRQAGGEPVDQLWGIGSFADLMVTYESSVVKIGRDVPLDVAALISCAVVTGFGAAAFTAGVGIGQSVAVLGAGGIGLNAIQGARFSGARQVVAIDRQPTNLRLAERFGATDTVLVGDDATDVAATVRELTGGGVDHAFEAIGLAATVGQAVSMLRKGGTATIIGILGDGAVLPIPAEAMLMERRLQTSLMGSARFKLHIPMLVELYQAGRLELDALMCERLPLAQVNEGFDSLAEGREGRALIVF